MTCSAGVHRMSLFWCKYSNRYDLLRVIPQGVCGLTVVPLMEEGKTRNANILRGNLI